MVVFVGGTFLAALPASAQVALGDNNIASTPTSTAVGIDHTASDDESTAMGVGSIASDFMALAIGSSAEARAEGRAEDSVELGAGSLADEANTVAVGTCRITDVADGQVSMDAVNIGQRQFLEGQLQIVLQ